MKNIIKRNLPLNQKYTLIDKKYIPLINGNGCTCDNCGKLIANIATIKADKIYNIGFDCLDTILLNNQILSNSDLLNYEAAKKELKKIIALSKKLKTTIENNKHVNITGILIENIDYDSNYLTVYWLIDNAKKSNNNECIKYKNQNTNMIIETLKNIFPTLYIDIK